MEQNYKIANATEGMMILFFFCYVILKWLFVFEVLIDSSSSGKVRWQW